MRRGCCLHSFCSILCSLQSFLRQPRKKTRRLKPRARDLGVPFDGTAPAPFKRHHRRPPASSSATPRSSPAKANSVHRQKAPSATGRPPPYFREVKIP